MAKSDEPRKPTVGAAVDRLLEAVGGIRNVLGACIVGMFASAWMFVVLLGSQWPVWLVAMLALPLTVSFGVFVFVVGKAGLTDPNNLLQTEYLDRLTKQDEQVELKDYEDPARRRLAAGGEETSDVDA